MQWMGGEMGSLMVETEANDTRNSSRWRHDTIYEVKLASFPGPVQPGNEAKVTGK